MREWIVILEATSCTSPIDKEAVRRLVQAVAAMRPGALYSVDRYALQMYATGESPTEALATALHRWHQEVDRIGGELGGCTLARVEVLTPEEYELEHDLAGHTAGAPDSLTSCSDTAEGDELLRRALLDSVTGLPGQELFIDTVDRSLITSDRRHVALLVVDVDGGTSTSTASCRTADHVWQQLAARIVTNLRPGDTATRLNPDQFGVFLEATSEQTAAVVAARLAEAIQAPLSVGDGSRLCVTATVGVAMGDGGDAQALVRQAQLAALRAREAGAGQVGWFSPCAPAPDDWATPTSSEVRTDTAGYLAMLTEVARATNGAATLEEAAGMAIKQVCAHTGWPAGRLCQRDGDDLYPTDVRWISSPQWCQRWADANAADPSPPGGGLSGLVTTVILPRPAVDRRPSPADGPVMALSVPVLVGSEVVAVLEFLADQTVKPDEPIVELLASVGIQLGRVVERERTHAEMQRLRHGEASGSAS